MITQQLLMDSGAEQHAGLGSRAEHRQAMVVAAYGQNGTKTRRVHGHAAPEAAANSAVS